MDKMQACGDAGFYGVQVWLRVKCTNRTTNHNRNTTPICNLNSVPNPKP